MKHKEEKKNRASQICDNTCVTRIPERDMREKGLKGISEEIMNGQKLCKINETKQLQTKEAQRAPSRIYLCVCVCVFETYSQKLQKLKVLDNYKMKKRRKNQSKGQRVREGREKEN